MPPPLWAAPHRVKRMHWVAMQALRIMEEALEYNNIDTALEASKVFVRAVSIMKRENAKKQVWYG